MSSWGKKGSEPHDLGYFLDAVCGPVFFPLWLVKLSKPGPRHRFIPSTTFINSAEQMFVNGRE